MSKLPFIPFYPSDWLRDTRRLSAATKGVWIDILAIAWNEPERGIYHRTQEAMLRELGITKDDWDNQIAIELAEVSEIEETGNGLVTIMSRRMVKEEKMREMNRNRKRVQRSHANIQTKSQQSPRDMSYVRSHISEVICHKEKKKRENAPTRFQKPSIDEVSNFFKTEGIVIDVHHFYDYYESNGWKIGRNPMKDWHATARNWARRENHESGTHNVKLTQTDPKRVAVYES